MQLFQGCRHSTGNGSPETTLDEYSLAEGSFSTVVCRARYKRQSRPRRCEAKVLWWCMAVAACGCQCAIPRWHAEGWRGSTNDAEALTPSNNARQLPLCHTRNSRPESIVSLVIQRRHRKRGQAGHRSSARQRVAAARPAYTCDGSSPFSRVECGRYLHRCNKLRRIKTSTRSRIRSL